MNYRTFYSKLFRPLSQAIGPIDRDTIVAIIGFDFGGPLNFCTIGAKKKSSVVTYVSCELAVRQEQVPSSHGRFELMCHCDDEKWARQVLSKIGEMSLEAQFDHLHTVEMSPVVGQRAKLRGVVLERFVTAKIKSKEFSILRVHGVSKQELAFAAEEGSEALFAHLKKQVFYPSTLTKRKSTL